MNFWFRHLAEFVDNDIGSSPIVDRRIFNVTNAPTTVLQFHTLSN